MTTTRDKLIADWRDRLAAAEATDLSSASRPAWLARLQIRLYRFLLSLYGHADWATNPPPSRKRTNAPTNSAYDSVVFDSPDALPLRGKPAKSAGKIQAVLKAVATAREGPQAAGPLVAENWVLVARARRHGVARRCAEFFRARGICARAVDHEHESSVEVSACFHAEAIRILPSIVSAMASPARLANGSQRVIIQRRGGPPSAFSNFLVCAAMVGPILAMVLTLMAGVIASARAGLLVDIHQGPIFLGSWSVIVIAAALAYLTPLPQWLFNFTRRNPARESANAQSKT